MRPFLAVLALGLSATWYPTAADDPMQQLIEREMSGSGVPGMSYAVVSDGDIPTVGAYGVVRTGEDRQITPDTAFLTGSIAKSFTALAVMQLVEVGEIELDAGISEYLDGFAGRPAAAITIRQLLSHTSGFSTLQGNASHTDDTGGRDELARRVDRLAGLSPAYSPGERWEYSNVNYQILGRLLEVVSEESYQTYVMTNILQPLGMDDSFVADGDIHGSMAVGHRPWFGTKQPLSDNRTDSGTAPQGGIIASAGDMARYLQTMMNGEDDVLSADGKALMMRPASEASPFYGFGWFLDTAEGTVSHSGLTPGFESLATMVPAEQKAVVVLVNGSSGMGFGETTQLLHSITAEALGLDYTGEGSRWFQQATFLGLALLPIFYLLSMIWAWQHRAGLRAKSGVFGLFSLWFPLLTTVVAAWVIIDLVPRLLGTPLGTLTLFQPDLGLVLIASAVTGVLWAVFRLGVAYTGRLRPAGSLRGPRPMHPQSANEPGKKTSV